MQITTSTFRKKFYCFQKNLLMCLKKRKHCRPISIINLNILYKTVALLSYITLTTKYCSGFSEILVRFSTITKTIKNLVSESV